MSVGGVPASVDAPLWRLPPGLLLPIGPGLLCKLRNLLLLAGSEAKILASGTSVDTVFYRILYRVSNLLERFELDTVFDNWFYANKVTSG